MRILIVARSQRAAKPLEQNLISECYVTDFVNFQKFPHLNYHLEDYDFIVVRLPYRSASRVIESIQNSIFLPPVLCIIEDSNPTKTSDLINSGADDSVGEPFSSEEILARIRAILRRPPRQERKNLEIGNIRLDSDTHQVWQSKKLIELGNREFYLLEYLMKNVDRVVTKNMILENVWDRNADILSNTVEVHIARLRSKLRNGGNVIKTIRGVGYKLISNPDESSNS